MPGSMERASMSPPSTPEGAAPPAPSVPGSSGKLLRAKNKIMSALNRAKSAQRGTHARSFEAKFDDLQPAGFSSPDTELRSISPSPTHTPHRERWTPPRTLLLMLYRGQTRPLGVEGA